MKFTDEEIEKLAEEYLKTAGHYPALGEPVQNFAKFVYGAGFKKALELVESRWPSDEEIESEAIKFRNANGTWSRPASLPCLRFQAGARWMRERLGIEKVGGE